MRWLLLIYALGLMSWAQNARFSAPAQSTASVDGRTVIIPIPNAKVQVYNYPGPVVNCSTSGTCNLATTYADQSTATACGAGTQLSADLVAGCKATADQSGNFGFWASPGLYQYCVSSSQVPALCFNASLSAPASAAAGTFTNLAQNDFVSALLGGMVIGTEYSGQQGGQFATESLVGGVTVPVSSTVHQANGVAGYCNSNSPTTFCVGLYGQAVLGTAGAQEANGINTVASDAAGISGSIAGAQFNTNVHNASTAVYGISLPAAWTAQPTGTATAFNISQPGSGTIHWQNGIVFGGNATNNTCAGGGSCGAIVLNQSGTGAGQDSQEILFNSSSHSGGILLSEASNALVLNTNTAFQGQLTTNNTAGSLTIRGGIAGDGSGFKHKRGTTGCTTGAAAGAACTTVVTWTTTFADANYTAQCGGRVVASGVPLNGGLTAQDAASVTFQTVAATAAAAKFTNIDCIAVHD